MTTVVTEVAINEVPPVHLNLVIESDPYVYMSRRFTSTGNSIVCLPICSFGIDVTGSLTDF